MFCLVVYSSPQSRQESKRALISTIASIFSWICLFLGFVNLQVKGLNISTSGGHYHSSYWVCFRKSPNPSCSKSKYLVESPNYECLRFFFYFSPVSRWWPFVFFSERQRQQFTILQANQCSCYYHKFYAPLMKSMIFSILMIQWDSS